MFMKFYLNQIKRQNIFNRILIQHFTCREEQFFDDGDIKHIYPACLLLDVLVKAMGLGDSNSTNCTI